MSIPSQRLSSLDVFRGATIAGMMLVNNPGSWSHIYPPFAHASWHGWTYTDTIFPFFLWIVGVAMTFSMTKRMERGADRTQLLKHTIQRALIIFGIGLFLTGFPFGLLFGHTFEFATWRFPGVLQRIAVCYLIASIIVLYAGVRWQFRWIGILLVVYWIAVKVIPVPGYGPGVLEPQGNLVWYIDANLLGGHTWRGAPVKGFDPEGIFSTLPAIATVLFGVMTGHFVRSDRPREEKTAWMFFWGIVLMLGGLIMDNWLPINKNLWTSAYTVFMAGLALVVFAACYWIIDVKGYRWGARWFEIYGLNAITMFFLAGFIGRLSFLITWTNDAGDTVTLKQWYYATFFTSWITDPMAASFAHSAAFMLFLYAIAWGMYKKNIILKV